MALTDDGGNGMVMPVTPMGNYGNGGFGGDWSSWIILLLIFGMFGSGGWGMGGFGGGLGIDFPWILNGQNNTDALVSSGFQNAQISGQLNGIQSAVTSGFGDVQLGIAGVNQAICQTGNGIVAAVTGVQNAISQQMYSNEIANLNRSFAEQTANSQGFNALQGQLAQCCYDNRLATAQTQSLVQNEGNATRFADLNNTRDLITAFNGGIQSLKDQLCEYRNEQKDDTIAQLRSELMYARGQASRDVQTAAIQAGQRALANEVEQYVAPMPRPAYIVQNPNCCGTNYGCGYGM